MSTFQEIVQNALTADNVDDSELDTNVDEITHWQRICAAAIAAVSAGCTALKELDDAAIVLNCKSVEMSAKEKAISWNWHTKKFDAKEDVWNSLIRENPKTAGLRGKSCLHWDNFDRLWSSSRATGNIAFSGRERRMRLDDLQPPVSSDAPTQSTNHPSYSAYRDVCGSPSFTNATSEQQGEDVSASQATDSSGKSKGKRKAVFDLSPDDNRKMLASTIEELSRAIVKSADILANKVPQAMQPHPNSADLFAAIICLDLPLQFRLESYDYLADNDKIANKFLGATEEFRAEMLKRIMGSRDTR